MSTEPAAAQTRCAGTASLLIEVDDEIAALHPGKTLVTLLAGWAPVGVRLGLMDEHGFAQKPRASAGDVLGLAPSG